MCLGLREKGFVGPLRLSSKWSTRRYRALKTKPNSMATPSLPHSSSVSQPNIASYAQTELSLQRGTSHHAEHQHGSGG
jgi:hypothetical protein